MWSTARLEISDVGHQPTSPGSKWDLDHQPERISFATTQPEQYRSTAGQGANGSEHDDPPV
jgi:hypothetical protein